MAVSRIERKLAAILYADVAGYSRLTGVDEEGTHRRLSEYLDAVTAAVEGRAGRVVHYAGDAVLAEFSSVIDAVSCAMAIQADLRERNASFPADRRVEFRIGINLGDVMVDRNDIYGDGVNVAARLEGLAEAGGICVSEAVFNQVRDRLDIDFQRLGQQRVKNIAQPVTAFRLLLDGERPAICAESGIWQRFLARKRLIVLTLSAVLAGAGAAAVILMAAVGPPDTAPSVTVMQFRAIGDGGPTEFSEGLTEDLVTELAKRTELRVSVLAPDAGPDMPDDRVELRARYRVEGSVRVAEGQVRITAQLISAESGFHLWGARYDRPMDDTLAVQAEVATRIVSNVEDRLARAEVERTAAGTTVADILLRGLEHVGRFGERAVFHVMTLYDRLFGGTGNA